MSRLNEMDKIYGQAAENKKIAYKKIQENFKNFWLDSVEHQSKENNGLSDRLKISVSSPICASAETLASLDGTNLVVCQDWTATEDLWHYSLADRKVWEASFPHEAEERRKFYK